MHKPSNTLQQVKEWLEKSSRFPFETMKKWDALYYIQQLEETVSMQKEKYKRLLETASILSDAIDEMED